MAHAGAGLIRHGSVSVRARLIIEPIIGFMMLPCHM